MNIYIGNLGLDVTEEELRKEFAVFGQVITVNIMDDKYIGSGQSRGYGFVEMPSEPEGKAAIAALNEKEIRHRIINVVEALPLSNISCNISNRYRMSGRFSSRVRQKR
ncbi:MAG: hypothetical protein PHQ86_08180 [Dehalococcoidales bacterium]|nr:hypothetical protein [Dehalococcoidales bacterium]